MNQLLFLKKNLSNTSLFTVNFHKEFFILYNSCSCSKCFKFHVTAISEQHFKNNLSHTEPQLHNTRITRLYVMDKAFYPPVCNCLVSYNMIMKYITLH
jgi:hypothetical protein